MNSQPLSKILQTHLLKVAAHSIKQGIETKKPLLVNPADYPPELRELRATFVTLMKADKLRGCIGILQACRPLINDVAHNAYQTAFADRRFSPVQPLELSELDIHISILSPPQLMQFDSEKMLIQQLRPHVDGLILKVGHAQGTFLPSVWETLSNPNDFLRQLKQKAGLSTTYWSENIEIYRYTTEYISGKL